LLNLDGCPPGQGFGKAGAGGPPLLPRDGEKAGVTASPVAKRLNPAIDGCREHGVSADLRLSLGTPCGQARWGWLESSL